MTELYGTWEQVSGIEEQWRNEGYLIRILQELPTKVLVYNIGVLHEMTGET